MVVGFTGTRERITLEQFKWIRERLDALADAGVEEFHHGDCVGADELANFAAASSGIHVVIHPPLDPKARAFCHREMFRDDYTLKREDDYLPRNQNIVNASERMLALPDGPEKLRSGTWSTIRYAVRIGIPVEICYPDGTTEVR